jgi:hypothetical protein
MKLSPKERRLKDIEIGEKIERYWNVEIVHYNVLGLLSKV